VVTFLESDARIAADRAAITDRAGRWATFQVGRHGRSCQWSQRDPGCDWHTVMDAVVHYGTPLSEDPNRIGDVTAIGLDEVLFCRSGLFKRRAWSTQVVDVARGQRLDIVPGRRRDHVCLVRQPARRVVRVDPFGDAGSVRPVSGRVQHHAAPRRPDHGPVPRREARQLRAR
jgi:hypothetical protein